MDKRGRKKRNVLRISVVLISILLGIFAEGSWAQAPPSVVSKTPVDGAVNVLINTEITVQFDMTMDTGASSITVRNDYGQDVAGTIQWRTTTLPDDTLVFTPQNGLKPATGYSYEGNGQAATGGSAWFDASFMTKFSLADVTPPTVQTTYPYDGMTDVLNGESIALRFSEAMNPVTIVPGIITLTGPGISGTSDYTVSYSIRDGEAEIRKNTPFTASSLYTVLVTTYARDVRGNPLQNQYSWSFTTGAADLTNPTVTKTIPVDGDIKVSLFPILHVFFSEEMDESTFNGTNITLYDDTADIGVSITFFMSYEDYTSFGPQSPLTYGHQYRVTIGTGVRDRHGNNGLSSEYTWLFTTAADGVDSDPALYDGADRDEQMGRTLGDGSDGSVGSSRVQLGVSAYDEDTYPLTVTATTSGHAPWTLNLTGGYNYSYESTGNEGLSSGNKVVTFTVQDGAPEPPNTVTFDRNIYIFSKVPTLSSPANGATGVSTTPTFEWSYSGGDRPLYYGVAVFDGPDMSTAPMVWMAYMVDQGTGTYSISIPADKKLSPNKTYYWGVRGANRENNGETFGGLWPFTTGGTPPPAPLFAWAWARSDDIYPPAVQGSLLAKVAGPSPADIVELKVTKPGGFQYIFTEDDILTSEALGDYYMANFQNPLSNGTYTFSLTDSAGRTVTVNRDFTLASVPRVVDTTMLPVDNSYVNATTPTLSWESVGAGYYYRVSIWDWNSNQRPVFMSKYIQATSITIPSGYLLPNTSYYWRVDVYDTPNTPNGNNRSRSRGLRFSTGSSSYTPANMIEWVNFYNDNGYYGGPGTAISTNVVGPLPNEVTSFSVSGPGFNYDFQQSNIMYNLAWPHGSMYNFRQPGAPAGGDYTLNLQTPLGNDSFVKNLTPSTLPIVDQSSLSPANNAYLTNLAPTFSWASVAGGPYYYRIMVQDWKLKYTIYASARSTDLFAAIPAGILRSGRSYMWRVEVYDESTGNADNRSTTGWNCFKTPRNWLIDFEGEGRNSDISVYNTSTGVWYVLPSSGIPSYGVGWGGDATDKPVPGDYDGDRKTDIAVYRSNIGGWYILPSSGASPYSAGWGGDASDIPVPRDYDGDGKTDIAVYRASAGAWYILPSGGGAPYGLGWGGDASDIPVPGDYDGDGKTDIAVYRSNSGGWYIIPSSGAPAYGVAWGGDASDIPAPGDYDGDGKPDIAVYRASTGAWYVSPSGGGASYGLGWGGVASDKPVPGDYDDDGKMDIAIYRPGNGAWYVIPSRGGSPYGVGWGGDASDIPLSANITLTN
jgi:hypothetical protein